MRSTIAQRAQSETELRESREFLSSITAAAMDGIVMIDHEGIIRYWNPAATTIFGLCSSARRSTSS